MVGFEREFDRERDKPLYLPIDTNDRMKHWVSGEWRTVVPKGPPHSRDWEAIHACNLSQLIENLGEEIWTFEYGSETKVDWMGSTFMGWQGRILEKTNWSREAAKQFAGDCVERVLGIYEQKYPGDDRVQMAIEAARQSDKKKARHATTEAKSASFQAEIYEEFTNEESVIFGRQIPTPASRVAAAAANAASIVYSNDYPYDAVRSADLAVRVKSEYSPDMTEVRWQVGKLHYYLHEWVDPAPVVVLPPRQRFWFLPWKR